MLRDLYRLAGSGRRIFGTPYVGLPAAQIASETATGEVGPGALYNEAADPANAGKRLRMQVNSWPVAGSLFVSENGAVVWSGLPDGLHSFPYTVFVDDVSTGTATYTVAVGGVSVVVDGAVLTGTGSIIPGTADGQQSITVDGAVLTGTGQIIPGTVDATQDAVADGAVLTGTGQIIPGTAEGQQNVTVDGAVLTGTGSIIPGTVSIADVAAGASAGLRVLVVPGRRLVLLSRKRGEVMSFSQKKAGERLLLGFDLARLLSSGERIESAVFSISPLRGSDDNSAAMISGGALVEGSRCCCFFVAGVPGRYYSIELAATTSFGPVFVERGTLEVTA